MPTLAPFCSVALAVCRRAVHLIALGSLVLLALGGCGPQPVGPAGLSPATQPARDAAGRAATGGSSSGQVYTLRAQRDGNRCVGVAGAEAKDGEAAVLATCDGGALQNWTLDGGQLRLTDSLCLTPQGGDAIDGSRLGLAACSGHPALWSRRDNQLVWGDNLCLDLPGGDITPGSALQVWRCGGVDNQQWQWAPGVGAPLAQPATSSPPPPAVEAGTSGGSAPPSAPGPEPTPVTAPRPPPPSGSAPAAPPASPPAPTPAAPPPPAKASTAGPFGIRPSAPVGERVAATVTFYEAWKKTYLTAGACDSGQLYVAHHGNASSPPSISVSEGHGWGMLALALMHAHDPQAQADFDSMVRFMRAHPSAAGSGLMAWDIHAPCDSAPGASSATDADLDMAFALLAAHAAWGSAGAIAYDREAARVMDALMKTEVDAGGHFLALWENIGAGAEHYGHTRISDLMMSHLRAFAAAQNDPRWLDVVEHGYAMVASLQAQGGHGMLPDFAIDAHEGGHLPAGRVLEKDGDGTYSWNACRIPLRLGVDFLLHDEPRAKAALGALVATLKSASGGDPAHLGSGYAMSGECLQPGGSMAFLAPVAVGAAVDPAHQAWLDALWQAMVAPSVDKDQYYGNTIKLLAMMALSDLWPAL